MPKLSREQLEAQRAREKDPRDPIADLLEELFGGYDTQRSIDEERDHGGERG